MQEAWVGSLGGEVSHVVQRSQKKKKEKKASAKRNNMDKSH